MTHQRLTAITRRDLLRAGAGMGVLGSLGLSGLARAEVSPQDRRFVFVCVDGGWDPTYSVSPVAGMDLLPDELRAQVLTLGGHEVVSHPLRPSVDTFFRSWGSQTSILHGLLVRSVNHDVCQRLVMTASAGKVESDWPTLLGSALGERYSFPSLVLGGFSSPGKLDRFNVLAGSEGQINGLFNRDFLDMTDQRAGRLLDVSRQRADDLLRARIEASLGEGASAATEVYDDALARVERARLELAGVNLAASSFRGEVTAAVQTLRSGVARCVTIGHRPFDTHGDNNDQTREQETLFNGLDLLMTLLSSQSGQASATMLQETTVIVLSEMGRTPYLKPSGGKDHWPYTTALVAGSGIRGGVSVGAYDSSLQGQATDLRTGIPRADGTWVHPGHLGSTLLHLGGVSRPEHLASAGVIEALLA